MNSSRHTAAAADATAAPTSKASSNIISTNEDIAIRTRMRKSMADMWLQFSTLLQNVQRNTHFSATAAAALQQANQQSNIEAMLVRDMNGLFEKDRELQTLLAELLEHQQRQQKIVELRRRLAQKDDELTLLSQSLEQTHAKLQKVMHDTRPIVKSQARQLPADMVLSYAHRVSATTSAPFNFVDGQPLNSHLPPHPQEMHWKASLLYSNNLQRYKRQYQEQKAKKEEEEEQKKRAAAAEGAPAVAAKPSRASVFPFFGMQQQVPISVPAAAATVASDATSAAQARNEAATAPQKISLFAVDEDEDDDEYEDDE